MNSKKIKKTGWVHTHRMHDMRPSESDVFDWHQVTYEVDAPRLTVSEACAIIGRGGHVVDGRDRIHPNQFGAVHITAEDGLYEVQPEPEVSAELAAARELVAYLRQDVWEDRRVEQLIAAYDATVKP